MGLFGAKPQQQGDTGGQGALGVDTITSASTPPTITETAPGTFAVPIITGPSMGTPPSEALPTVPMTPATPVTPDAPREAVADGANFGEPTTPAPDPLSALNNTFGTNMEPAPITLPTPTVITPGEPANPLDVSPSVQEDILASGQSAAASDGSLPAELGDNAVLGEQQPAITTAMPGGLVAPTTEAQGQDSTLPSYPALPEEAIIQPAGNGVDMGTVREAFETRDALEEALRGAQDAIRVALDKIEVSPEAKSGGE